MIQLSIPHLVQFLSNKTAEPSVKHKQISAKHFFSHNIKLNACDFTMVLKGFESVRRRLVPPTELSFPAVKRKPSDDKSCEGVDGAASSPSDPRIATARHRFPERERESKVALRRNR